VPEISSYLIAIARDFKTKDYRQTECRTEGPLLHWFIGLLVLDSRFRSAIHISFVRLTVDGVGTKKLLSAQEVWLMVHEMIDGTYRQTNLPNESAEYLAKREEVRLAEIELMRQKERVAELRRAMPEGATIPDYEFLEGPTSLDEGDEPVTKVRLSELFTASGRSLVIYHFMFGKKQTTPCPMCTAWIDCFNGIAHHLAQSVDLAIVAAADLPELRAHARNRGWDRLRLLSAGSSTFKYDLGSEDGEGNQDSTISVFTKDSDGTLRHFYSVHPRLSEDIEERGIDEYNPIWNVLDLTPQGRGKFYTALEYGKRLEARG
jgi:predicted dithiol-disulfide oxidoreductase (DUF899 family)